MGRRKLVALLAASGALLRPLPAHACYPGGATGAWAAPKDGTVVPRNTPAVYAYPGWGYGTQCSLTSVTLTKEPATPIALLPSSVPNAFVPSTELEAGASYLLEYSGNCVFPWSVPGQSTFVVSQSKPLPLETGKLEVLAAGTGSVPWSQGSCSWPTVGAWVVLRLRPSCELEPFLPVTRFTTSANGKSWWRSGVGSTAIDLDEGIDGRTVDLVFGTCGGPGGWGQPIGEGKVAITVQAEVVGAPVDPKPAVLVVDLYCDADAGTTPPYQALGHLVDTSMPCISDFDAATPAPDAGLDASSDAKLDAGPLEDSSAPDVGSGGGAGAPEDACADVGETGAPAPDSGQPADEHALDAGGGCTGCVTDDRAPASECAPVAMLIAAWLARRRRRRARAD